jgi:hypothetical protein
LREGVECGGVAAIVVSLVVNSVAGGVLGDISDGIGGASMLAAMGIVGATGLVRAARRI